MELRDFKARIRPLAAEDLKQIVVYLDARSRNAGDRFLQSFSRATDLLRQMPRAGALRRQTGRLKGLRSWPMQDFGPYIIFYMPLSDGIDILRVLHGARNVDREIRK